MTITNKGKANILGLTFRGATAPTNFYLALSLAANAPTVNTNTFGEVDEIADGNGYTTGGYQLTRNSTDFDTLTQDQTNTRALTQLKNIVWTASGGDIPDSGLGARYALLTDDNITVGSREVWAYWDLTSARSISDGQTLTLADCELRLSAP